MCRAKPRLCFVANLLLTRHELLKQSQLDWLVDFSKLHCYQADVYVLHARSRVHETQNLFHIQFYLRRQIEHFFPNTHVDFLINERIGYSMF